MITTIISALLLQTSSSSRIPGMSASSEALLVKATTAIGHRNTNMALLYKSASYEQVVVGSRFTSFANRVAQLVLGLPPLESWQGYVSGYPFRDRLGDSYLVPVSYQSFKRNGVKGTVYVTSFGLQVVFEGLGSPLSESYSQQHDFALQVLQNHTQWKIRSESEALFEPPQDMVVTPLGGMKGNGVGIVAKPGSTSSLKPEWRHLVSFWIGPAVTVLDIPYSDWLDPTFGKGTGNSLQSEPNSRLTALSDALWIKREAKRSGGR